MSQTTNQIFKWPFGWYANKPPQVHAAKKKLKNTHEIRLWLAKFTVLSRFHDACSWGVSLSKKSLSVSACVTHPSLSPWSKSRFTGHTSPKISWVKHSIQGSWQTHLQTRHSATEPAKAHSCSTVRQPACGWGSQRKAMASPTMTAWKCRTWLYSARRKGRP